MVVEEETEIDQNSAEESSKVAPEPVGEDEVPKIYVAEKDDTEGDKANEEKETTKEPSVDSSSEVTEPDSAADEVEVVKVEEEKNEGEKKTEEV